MSEETTNIQYYLGENSLHAIINGVKNNFSRTDHTHNDIYLPKDETKTYIDTIIQEYMYSNVEEPFEDDVPRVFINGIIPTTKDDVEAELTYISKTETFHSYILIKCQGTSSMSYPKKNFTIKLYSDAERTNKLKKDFRGWGEQSKFCLKANYIDSTHARNIICARLWSKACDTRENLNERLASSPNNGAIDGFHIKVYANGVYQGLYTWNIPKDGWMFGMDSNGNEAVYCCEVQTEAGQFRQEVLADESDWSLEYPDADEVNASVLTGFNNLVHVVKDTTDEEFIEQLPTVLDIEAAIDYYLFCYYFAALDQLGKNMIMVTYDGGNTWIPSAYDNDSTWGSYWDGNSMIAYDYACPEQYECSQSLLWERIENLFGEKLYNRYLELTDTNAPWSLANIITEIEEFYNIPRNELYAEDKSIFAGIPSTVTLSSMRNYMANRKPYVDKCLYEIGVYISLEGIAFQRDEIILGAGESVMLRIVYTPSDARSRNYTVNSNNTYVKVEKNGEFVILTVDDSIRNNQTVNITVTSEEYPTISGTLIINAITTATQSHTKPVISFDSEDYNNGTWIDSVNGTSMVFSGTPSKSEDGVMFDGTQTCYFSNNNYANSDITVEFMGTLGDLFYGRNVLVMSPDTSFNWYNSYGIWTSGSKKEIYSQYYTMTMREGIVLEDDKKYIHFLLCCPNSTGRPSNIYANLNGRLYEFDGVLNGTNNPNNMYIGNAEGTNHFLGTIRKLNVYNYIPSVSDVKEILGIPATEAYSTITITSDMMELGSLSNIPEQLGSEVWWDEEIRTDNYVTLPTDATEVSLGNYFGSDRIYFYDINYKCISEITLSRDNQVINIPSNAIYMKFLLMTTNFVDTNITYYK